MPELILDCDGVLLDYATACGRWLCERHGLDFPGGPPDTFCMTGWLGMEKNDIIRGAREFNSGRIEAFANIDPIQGAVEGVRRLAGDGWDLTVLTSMSDDPAARAQRVRNLEMHFGPVFRDVIALPFSADKDPALASMAPSIFVDDLMKNVLAGNRTGHRSIIMDQAYNRGPGHHGIERASDWTDLVDIVMTGPGRPGNFPSDDVSLSC